MKEFFIPSAAPKVNRSSGSKYGSAEPDINSIIMEARKYKEMLDKEQPRLLKHLLHPLPLQKKDSKNNLKPDHFNPAPSQFVTRKRLPSDDFLMEKIPAKKSTHLDFPSKDKKECPNYYFNDEPQNAQRNITKVPRRPGESPIPDFISKDLPLQADTMQMIQLPAANISSSSSTPVILKKDVISTYASPEDLYNKKGGTEEPVRNSMFWLYRNFPHIY